jgi:DNA-binding NtrC family response regulator
MSVRYTEILATATKTFYCRSMPMTHPRVLLAWVGQTDLNAARDEATIGPGPIAGALLDRTFDAAVLLNSYPTDDVSHYLGWLGERTGGAPPVTLRPAALPSPVDYPAIYRAAVATVEEVRREHGERAQLTFHLSPGTPAMAAIWLLLAKARYGATLIDSSRQHGVRDVELPFEIAAEFVPALLRDSDRRVGDLAAALPPNDANFSDIVGRSETIRRAVDRARMVAPYAVPVLVEGESGTGKELFARAIHRASSRARGPFQAVNCGAIPATLVESTLFGHVKGAFSGADRPAMGIFRAADRGTLLLDEIGELPLEAQAKLLRVLQEREVTPVGGTSAVAVDVRVIAATNRTLVDEVAAGRFREDLYYRLAVGVITLPPLRRREGDLGLLIDHHLTRINRDQAEAVAGWKEKRLSPGARKLLLEHRWPGNVRELVNTLTRAVIWCTGEVIRESEMHEAFHRGVRNAGETILFRPLGDGLDIRDLQSEVARHYLERAMDKANGNKTRAAELVGLPSYQTLTNWLEKYGIKE